MLALVSLLLPAFADTDTIGGNDTYNNNGNMMKMVIFDVADAAVVTQLEFAVYNYRSSSTIQFALYEADEANPERYTLVEGLDGTANVDEQTQGWASSGDVTWVLEPGRSYAMGVWIGDDWYYYYQQGGSSSPWFGDVVGGLRVEQELPASFSATAEDYYYLMRITSEDADVDGDGVVAERWGGADCNDEDPAVGAAAEEVPYDGIDQDCDGADLEDVDGDGAAGEAAGGADCNDENAAIGPEVEEICDNGVDEDCVGGDESCADGLGGGKDGLTVPGGCSCTSASGQPMGLIGLLLAGGLWRRRRT
jgi:MYXO-CTERM domain-containing protein